MNIVYDIESSSHKYESNDSNLNFLLSKDEDFLNLGIIKNTSKHQGYIVSNSNEKYKIIDEFMIEGATFNQIKYDGVKTIRKFSVNNKNYEDIYYLSSKGLVYSSNYDSWIYLDLDCKNKNDFDKWGRNYKIYKKNNIYIIEYTKTKTNQSDNEYQVFLGILGSNITFEKLEQWIEKEYDYSKMRGTESNIHIFRALRFKTSRNNKVFFCYGFSQEEVLNKTSSIERGLKKEYSEDKIKLNKNLRIPQFKKLLTSNVNLGYKLSNNAISNFITKKGSVAGVPWFNDVWSRDELASMNSLILNESYELVKERLEFYINSINPNTGMIKRIDTIDSLESPDSVFWLSNRLINFISILDYKKKLNDFYSKEELNRIFTTLENSFKNIMKINFDREVGLLKVKHGDSWMDTIITVYPIDIQTQLLGFISNLSELAEVIGDKEKKSHYHEFWVELADNVKSKYFRDNLLYAEYNSKRVNCNVFLAYYFCPDLLTQKEWELVFDNSLKQLKTFWGGISSLSKFDSNYRGEYSGENNLSYHNGDSWFWINNIAAIVLHDVNEKKYREFIHRIIISSTKDILENGCIGYSSEISSAKEQKAYGCFAQLWSSAFYIEMIDRVFERDES